MEKPKIIDCFCSWYDLLGYGENFKKVKWDLHNELCYKNFERIDKVQELLKNPHTLGKTLLLNDGVIKTFDVRNMPNNDITNIINFLIMLIQGFDEINKKDKIGDQYGVRGVFTFGQRYEYTEYSFMTNGRDVSVYFPREFQMNTAFSKANIIEESGKKYGIEGAYLYFDSFALEKIREIADASDCNNVKDYVKDGCYYYHINFVTKPAITLVFDAKKIAYNNASIETDIYKLVGYELAEAGE